MYRNASFISVFWSFVPLPPRGERVVTPVTTAASVYGTLTVCRAALRVFHRTECPCSPHDGFSKYAPLPLLLCNEGTQWLHNLLSVRLSRGQHVKGPLCAGWPSAKHGAVSSSVRCALFQTSSERSALLSGPTLWVEGNLCLPGKGLLVFALPKQLFLQMWRTEFKTMFRWLSRTVTPVWTCTCLLAPAEGKATL